MGERVLARVTRRGTQWAKLDDRERGDHVLTSRAARVPGGYLAAEFVSDFSAAASRALLDGATVRVVR